jgi:hypothetical protein
MQLRVILVLTYIFCCFRVATAPWKYWQLNAQYFSADLGIFSKLWLDALIPERWRLAQSIDSDALEPQKYPVFLKPEWGQNAQGIHRVDNEQQLLSLREKLHEKPQRYLVQEAASGRREFEVFSIDVDRNDGRHDVLTVTETVNTRERYPINSKNNQFTRYSDISHQFNDVELTQLGNYLSEIGRFGISRLGIRADSKEALIAGDFHVFEVNLFVPMPMNLLDSSSSIADRWRFIRKSMMCLALATKANIPVEHEQPIFLRMMCYEHGTELALRQTVAKIGGHRTHP